MTDHAGLLRQIRNDARPYIEQALDLAEVFAGFRKLASENGLDWGVIKALVKAEIQDEREGGTDKVERIIEKADFASAYADMLGLGLGSAKMNENNFSSTVPILQAKLPPHDDETGEITEDLPPAETASPPADIQGSGPPAEGNGPPNSEPAPVPSGMEAGQGENERQLSSVAPPTQSAGSPNTADAAAGSDPRPDASLPPRTNETAPVSGDAGEAALGSQVANGGSDASPTSSGDPGEIPAFLRRGKAA